MICFFQASTILSRNKSCPDILKQQSQVHGLIGPYSSCTVYRHAQWSHAMRDTPNSVVLSKMGKGHHICMCAWPCPLTQHVGVKHCKIMASLHKYMGEILRGVSLIKRCNQKSSFMIFLDSCHSACKGFTRECLIDLKSGEDHQIKKLQS